MSKISPPNWAKDAIPTTRGWVKPLPAGKTGIPELLKSVRITQAEIDEYKGEKPVSPKKATSKKKPAAKKKAAPKKKVTAVNEQTNTDKVVLTEAPVPGKTLDSMTEEQKQALKETTGTTGVTLTE